MDRRTGKEKAEVSHLCFAPARRVRPGLKGRERSCRVGKPIEVRHLSRSTVPERPPRCQLSDRLHGSWRSRDIPRPSFHSPTVEVSVRGVGPATPHLVIDRPMSHRGVAGLTNKILPRCVAACEQFAADPAATRPHALRVRDVEGAPGVFEITFNFSGLDLRATLGWTRIDGAPAVRWRRIGGHAIFKDRSRSSRSGPSVGAVTSGPARWRVVAYRPPWSMERSHRGLVRRFAKPLWGYTHRGFESPPLRQTCHRHHKRP